jgi:formylglycine-generating enzyme required for sulfatase activity
MTMTRILPPPFEWCAIPAGPVALEDNPTKFEVAAFDMAKYPITNAQFRVFVEAGDGYASDAWWDFSPKAQRWRAQNGVAATSFPVGDLPRVKVSWYEAVAFCLWLRGRSGESITLPTEQEWQRAAQGDNRRLYPWGIRLRSAAATPARAASKEITSVTRCPGRSLSYGVMDMSGNVAEWCSMRSTFRMRIFVRLLAERARCAGVVGTQPAQRGGRLSRLPTIPATVSTFRAFG